jgi:hypothetical protein
VFGRIDPIQTYSNTTRTIEIAFDVVSRDTNEAAQNWIMINEMAQGLYAKYQKSGSEDVIATPPIFGIRFHNLIREVNTGPTLQDFVYGVLKSGVSIEPHIEEGYFYGGNLIKQNWGDENKATQYSFLPENYDGLLIFPKSFKISLSMEVLHSFFRGNSGTLKSPGGPSVSLLREQLPDQDISRTSRNERATMARRLELKQKREDQANKKLSGGK